MNIFFQKNLPKIKIILRDLFLISILIGLILTYINKNNPGNFLSYFIANIAFLKSLIFILLYFFIDYLTVRFLPKTKYTPIPKNYLKSISIFLKKNQSNKKIKLLSLDIFIVSTILLAFLTYLEHLNPTLIDSYFLIILSLVSIFSFFTLLSLKSKNFSSFLLILTLLITITTNSILIFSKFYLKNSFIFYEQTLFITNLIKENQLFLFFALFGIIIFVLFKKNPAEEEKQSIRENNFYNKKIILPFLLFIFLTIRFFMVIKFPGNFADDWQHIIAGLNFFENWELNRISNQFENGYLRGSFMSILTGFYIAIFGKSLLAAKLAPITIGLINFFIVFFIAKKLFRTKRFIFFLLLFYSFHPLIIFNHIYIRTYVFFEFFILALIFLFLKIKTELKKSPNFKKILLYLFFILIINYISWFWSFDQLKYAILFLTTISFGYLAIFDLEKIKTKTSLNPILKKILYSKKTTKIIAITIIFIIAGLFFIDFGKMLNWALNATAPSKRHQGSYFSLLFIDNFLLTSFLMASFYYIISGIKKNSLKKFVVFGGLTMTLLHLSLNKDAQITRGILYLLPILFIISFFTFETLITKTKSLFIEILTIIAFITLIIYSYPQNYLRVGPAIPFELGYADYSKTYQYLKNNHPDKKILQADYNIMSDLFFDLKTSYKIDFNNILKNGYTHEYNKELERNFEIPTQIPTIIEEKEFYDFIKNNETCVIIRPVSEEKFFTPETWDFLEKNFKKEVSFNTFTIYCE